MQVILEKSKKCYAKADRIPLTSKRNPKGTAREGLVILTQRNRELVLSTVDVLRLSASERKNCGEAVGEGETGAV